MFEVIITLYFQSKIIPLNFLNILDLSSDKSKYEYSTY